MHGTPIRAGEIHNRLPLAKADFSNIYDSTFLPTVPFFPLLEKVFIEPPSLVLQFVRCRGNRGDVPLKAAADR